MERLRLPVYRKVENNLTHYSIGGSTEDGELLDDAAAVDIVDRFNHDQNLLTGTSPPKIPLIEDQLLTALALSRYPDPDIKKLGYEQIFSLSQQLGVFPSALLGLTHDDLEWIDDAFNGISGNDITVPTINFNVEPKKERRSTTVNVFENHK